MASSFSEFLRTAKEAGNPPRVHTLSSKRRAICKQAIHASAIYLTEIEACISLSENCRWVRIE